MTFDGTLLNSSKHVQLPPETNPLKNLIKVSVVIEFEQWKTKHIFPTSLAASFVVSVFPALTAPSSEMA